MLWPYTINDKGFEGEKFSSLLGSSGMWGKVLRFFPSPPSYTSMVFQLYKTAMSVSTRASHSSREFSLKLPLAYSEMDENTLLTHLCANFKLSRITMQSQEESFMQLKPAVSPRWNRSLTASLLASSVSYFLISWQNPLDSSPLLWNISHGVNFQRSKSYQGKLSRFTKIRETAKVFSPWNFCRLR